MIGRKIRQHVVDVEIDEPNISRYQCTLFYKNNHWEINDGDSNNRTHSTNGTYLTVSRKTQIFNGMEFKCRNNTFIAEVIKPGQ